MAARRRPVITIVEARPMTDVNFKSNDSMVKEISKTTLNTSSPKPPEPQRRINSNASIPFNRRRQIYGSFEAINVKKENNFIKPPIAAARKSVLSANSTNAVNTIKSNKEDKSNGYRCETIKDKDASKQHGSLTIYRSGSTDELRTSGIESDSISFSEARSRFGGNWFGNKDLVVSAANLQQKGKATIIRPKSTFFNKTFEELDSFENEIEPITSKSDIKNMSKIIDIGDSGIGQLSVKPCLPRKPTIIKPKPLSKSMIYMNPNERYSKEKSASMNLDLKSIIDCEQSFLKNAEKKDERQADFIPCDGIKNTDLLAGLDFWTILPQQGLIANNANDPSDIFSNIPPTMGSDDISAGNINIFQMSSTLKSDRPARPAVGPKINNLHNLPSNKIKLQGPRALALYDYESGYAEDLNFKAGEIIILVNTVDGKWLKGHKVFSDELGIFPSNFVEIIEPLSSNPLETKVSTDLMTTEKPRYVAKYDFEGLQENGELSFREGDLILLNKRINDEWFEGQLHATGSTGMFPVTFVEEIHDLSEASNNSETKTVEPIKRSFKKVVALYDFHGGQSGDLDFMAGDSIEVIGEVNSDWLKGRIAGRFGIFPSGFVTDQ